MLAMATLDWIVLGVLALSLAVGAWRGLVYELLYGVGWVVAYFITRLLVPQLAPVVRPYASSWSPTVLYAAVFIVLFIALVFAWGLGSWYWAPSKRFNTKNRLSSVVNIWPLSARILLIFSLPVFV